MNRTLRSTVLWILCLVIGTCSVLFIFLFFTVIIPHFIVLPIQPPEDYYGKGIWRDTSYSVLTDPTYIPIIDSKAYIWRQFTYVASDHNRHQSESWQSIVTYFDDNLYQSGWVRSEVDAPCNLYLPEARFLEAGNNGYIHYFRKGFEKNIVYGSEYRGDVICLAVWSSGIDENNLPKGFFIVLLTARQAWSAIP